MREAAEATPSEDRRKLYNGLQADVAATQNVTQSLFDGVKQMRAEQEKLYEVGNELTETTNAIAGKVQAGSDEEIVRLVDKLYCTIVAVWVADWRTQKTSIRKVWRS